LAAELLGNREARERQLLGQTSPHLLVVRRHGLQELEGPGDRSKRIECLTDPVA
jgi:hypothetical protein